MPLLILCFAAGVALLQRQALLPALIYGAWLLPLALLIWGLHRGWPGRQWQRWLRYPLLALLCGGCGYHYAAARAELRLQDMLAPASEGRDLIVTGVVAGLPLRDERGVRFTFDIERAHDPQAVVPATVMLTWWSGKPPEIHAGERWQLTVRLRRPRGLANPHGFDYEAWLLERGIGATGSVRPRAGSRKVEALVQRPGYWIEAAREHLRARIDAVLPGAPYAGVLAALAIGDQRAIPADQWQTYTRTGVNHLISISGLHVTMVAGLVLALVHGLWRRSSRLSLWLPARKAAVLGGLAAALLYTLLAGFEVPAQRTLYMLAVVAVALWLNRVGSAAAVLAVALLAVLLIDPWAVLAAGFWLSFGAVAVILYVSVGRIGEPHWLANWGRVQWAVTVALAPALLVMFQQLSLVSPLANAFAIPVVSLGVVPLTLLGLILPVDALLHLAHFVMALCDALLARLAALPAAVWEQHVPPLWALAPACIGAWVLLLPRGFPLRFCGLAGFLPLFLAAPAPLPEGELQVTALDVGNGLAVVARTRDHALLFDAGPAFGPQADAGNRVIVPYLRAVGVRRLDTMIVSHDDIDHYGGASSVVQAVPVAQILSALPDFDPLLFEVPQAARCFAGQSWVWNGVRFDMLHPAPESYADARIKDNNRGCVLRIATAGAAVLIAADIEAPAERWLLAAVPQSLRAQVLIAPHHGSKTSSTPDFVQAVDPRIVIYTVGYRNRFGHPHPDVQERYLRQGSIPYRSDRDGAVMLRLDASDTVRVTPERASERRYWRLPLDGDAAPDPDDL